MVCNCLGTATFDLLWPNVIELDSTSTGLLRLVLVDEATAVVVVVVAAAAVGGIAAAVWLLAGPSRAAAGWRDGEGQAAAAATTGVK